MLFGKVYLKLLFSRLLWGHPFAVFLIGLHLVCWATNENPEPWRLFAGFALIFAFMAAVAFVGCVGGYIAAKSKRRD